MIIKKRAIPTKWFEFISLFCDQIPYFFKTSQIGKDLQATRFFQSNNVNWWIAHGWILPSDGFSTARVCYKLRYPMGKVPDLIIFFFNFFNCRIYHVYIMFSLSNVCFSLVNGNFPWSNVCFQCLISFFHCPMLLFFCLMLVLHCSMSVFYSPMRIGFPWSNVGFPFSKNWPLADSFIESRCPCIFCPLYM